MVEYTSQFLYTAWFFKWPLSNFTDVQTLNPFRVWDSGKISHDCSLSETLYEHKSISKAPYSHLQNADSGFDLLDANKNGLETARCSIRTHFSEHLPYKCYKLNVRLLGRNNHNHTMLLCYVCCIEESGTD